MIVKNNLTLHIMVGNIGTGKTVTTKRLMTELEDTFVVNIDSLVKMFSMDNYRPELFTEKHRTCWGELLKTLADKLLSHGFSVIIDTAMMSKVKRYEFIKIAQRYNAKVKVYLHTTSGGLERRCKENHGGHSNEVWKEVYEMFEKEYEKPSSDEDIDEIIDCTWDLNAEFKKEI